MEQSEQINELAGALAKAQGRMTGALKDSANPFFKSKYADLASCWDACREPLAANGLAVIQTTVEREGSVYVVTTLAHSSGQWIKGWLPVKAKDDGAQAQGSGLTYARRYALAAIVGIAQIDDDAEAAQGRKASEPVDELTAKQRGYAREFGEKFRAILKADRPEDEVVAEVYALHLEATEDQAVYAAAANFLDSKERASWKRCVSIGNKQQRAA